MILLNHTKKNLSTILGNTVLFILNNLFQMSYIYLINSLRVYYLSTDLLIMLTFKYIQ